MWICPLEPQEHDQATDYDEHKQEAKGSQIPYSNTRIKSKSPSPLQEPYASPSETTPQPLVFPAVFPAYVLSHYLKIRLISAFLDSIALLTVYVDHVNTSAEQIAPSSIFLNP
jgi:hypothetical protein